MTRFPATRAFAKPGDVTLIATSANAQPAVAEYRRDSAGVLAAHSIHVLTVSTDGTGGISAITVFLEPTQFDAFGMPPTW